MIRIRTVILLPFKAGSYYFFPLCMNAFGDSLFRVLEGGTLVWSWFFSVLEGDGLDATGF